jgi:hypothetical protein
MKRTAVIAALLALPAVSAHGQSRGPAIVTFAEAERDYQDVGSGKRRLHELSREEIRVLIELRDYLIARGTDTRTARERCIDRELARLNGPPSYLALRTIDLKCSQR